MGIFLKFVALKSPISDRLHFLTTLSFSSAIFDFVDFANRLTYCLCTPNYLHHVQTPCTVQYRAGCCNNKKIHIAVLRTIQHAISTSLYLQQALIKACLRMRRNAVHRIRTLVVTIYFNWSLVCVCLVINWNGARYTQWCISLIKESNIWLLSYVNAGTHERFST